MTARRLCPKLDACNTAVSRDEFTSLCVDGWSDCPLNSLKKPRRWLEELGAELGAA